MVTEPGPRINFLQYSHDGGNCWTLRLPVNQNYPDLCLCVAVMECCILQMFVPSHTFPLEQAQVYCLSGNTKLFFEEIHHGEFSGHFFEMWETNRCIKFSFFFLELTPKSTSDSLHTATLHVHSKTRNMENTQTGVDQPHSLRKLSRLWSR